MHATTEQLLELRDKRPIDATLAGHVEICGRCSDQLRQLEKHRQALLDLPQLAPSPQVFEQLTQRLEQEQAAQKAAQRQPLRFAAAAAVVAALALWLIPRAHVPVEPVVANAPSQTPAATAASVERIDRLSEALLERGAMLEAVMAQLSTMGSAPSSSTSDALNALETQLALVDYNLNAAQIDQYRPAELNSMLARRVDTLENMVGVQRAELARQGYHGFQVMTASNFEEEQTW